MRRLPLPALVAAATLALALALPAAAGAFEETPCGAAGLGCATVEVPLDRSGAVPGAIGLDVRRLPAAPAPTPTALVVLLGGPGQLASPVADSLAAELGPLAAGRDVVLFDERGVGGSGPLSCPSLSSTSTDVPGCAAWLGPARGSYTSAADAEDVEAIRTAGGYERLVLYGTSYGTKVALLYAAAHPERVERLVLDSVVGPEGPDPLQLSTFAALPRALRSLCAGGACRAITADPRADLGRLARRLARRPIGARYVDGRGRVRRLRLTATGLLEVLLAGDLDPILRATTPAAVRAALRDDAAPLARLHARAAGRSSLGYQSEESFNVARFVTTVCEETAFPWDRAAGPDARAQQAAARIRLLRPGQFAPFDRATVAGSGPLPLCVRWPVASAAPGPVTLPPGVPALLLVGEQDLRTPLEDARAVAGRLGPSAQVIAVGHVGHSVLGADVSGCARAAFAAFLAGGPAAGCEATRALLDPTAVPPRSLAAVPAYRGVPGRAGRTLTAASRTVTDAVRAQLSSALGGRGTSGVGGLRAGHLTVEADGLHLHGYSYVPGVAISGVVPDDPDRPLRLRVSGASAARGTIATGGGRVSGTLGGYRFDVAAASASAARAPAGFPIPALIPVR